jgi:hypothetical protein
MSRTVSFLFETLFKSGSYLSVDLKLKPDTIDCAIGSALLPVTEWAIGQRMEMPDIGDGVGQPLARATGMLRSRDNALGA